MPEPLPENVLPFHRPKKAFGVAEMSLWFQQMACYLDRGTFEPQGFLVVLINEEDQQLYRVGPPDLIEEAIAYARQDDQMRRHGQDMRALRKHPRPARQEVRDQRAQEAAAQAAYEATHPWVCEACQQRFATNLAAVEHETVGHVCRQCDALFPRLEDWREHTCPEENTWWPQTPHHTLRST